MKVAIGSDPNANEMKRAVVVTLRNLGHHVSDLGSDDPVYANVVIEVAESVVRGEYDRGVVLCGTGLGAAIAANKVPGAFCALLTDAYQAQRAALSNNANLIALGAQVTGISLATVLVETYMREVYVSGGRSEAKIARIREYERTHKGVINEKRS